MLKNPNVKEIRIDLKQGICMVELVYGECMEKPIAGMHEVLNYVAELINEDQLVISKDTRVILM